MRLRGADTAYNSGDNTQVESLCGPSVTLGNIQQATTDQWDDVQIKGALTTWPEDCTFATRWTITKKSTISGWTGEDYTHWDVTNLAGNESLVSTTVLIKYWTGLVLDRTLTIDTCSAGLIINRGEGTAIQCRYRNQHPGLENLPNNALMTGYARLTPRFDTTNFLAVNFQISGGGGVGTFTATAKTTTQDTNSTPTLDYLIDAEQYGASRTVGELYNIGTSANRLDVSSQYRAHAFLNAKSSSGTANFSVFIIGSDAHWLTAKRVMGARGNPLSGIPISCTRTDPNGDIESPVSLGNTNAQGDTSPAVQVTVGVPSGPWEIACSATHNGNTLLYEYSFIYASPLSSNQIVIVVARAWNISGQLVVNVTAHGTSYENGEITHNIPDDLGVHLFTHVWAPGNPVATHPIQNLLMTPSSNPRYFFANITLTGPIEMLDVEVHMNLSAKEFLGREQVSLPTVQGAQTTMIPEAIAVPSLLFILLLGATSLAFAIKSNVLNFLAGIVLFFGGWLTLQSSLTVEYQRAFTVLFTAAAIIIWFRAYALTAKEAPTDD